MSYRFSNTDKWSDEWFVDLNPNEKLMFLYFCDCCDIAGFYELSLRKMSFDLGLKPDEIKAAFSGLSKCYIVSKDKKVIFIKNFMKHQKNLPLNTQNKAHVGIISRFKNYVDRFDIDLYNLFNSSTIKGGKKPLLRGTGKGIGNDILFEEDKSFDFEVFWKLYNKKVGDKKKCCERWDALDHKTQELIIISLPTWNKQFTDIHFKPFPETYINQKRWNDEIIINEKIKEANGKTIIF